MTHTPGPWTTWPEGSRITIGTNSETLGMVSVAQTFFALPEDVANARLIAAAPDLLDAARLALDALNLSPTTSALSTLSEARVGVLAKLALRRAIAKATEQVPQ